MSRHAYGKGARPSPVDDRDWKLSDRRIGAISPVIPDKVDRDNLVELITDQSITSACCGHGTGRGWFTRARIQGDTTVAFPDPVDIYKKGRIAELPDPSIPLLDNGTYPRLTLKATADLGVVAMSPKWSDIGQINERPSWEELRESADRRGVRFAGVYGPLEMRRALASGYPLVVAFDVDRSFEDYKGGVWNGMRGRSLGGHCTCIIGYAPGKFRGVNSWSGTWGESGLYWMSDDAALGIEAWAVELVTGSEAVA